MVTPANYKPDEDLLVVIDAAVASLTTGTNLLAGPKEAYDLGAGIPHNAVFVNAAGGLISRPIKGGADERHPTVNIRIRGSGVGVAGSFPDGQQLARDVLLAVDQNPPVGYCETRATNSHPSYIGVDEDGHHEWLLFVEMTVDVL
jgi:hypothetical protein